MKKNLFIFTFLLGVFSLSAQAQKQEKTITVEVQNNWNQAKADAPVVINLHELHAGFKVKSAVVMEGTKEIPSQLDDLNRDRKMDDANRARIPGLVRAPRRRGACLRRCARADDLAS